MSKRLDISFGTGNAPHQVMVDDHDTGDIIAGMTKAEAINRLLSQPDLLAVARHCEELLLAHPINEVDGEEIADKALALIRAAIAKAEG